MINVRYEVGFKRKLYAASSSTALRRIYSTFVCASGEDASPPQSDVRRLDSEELYVRAIVITVVVSYSSAVPMPPTRRRRGCHVCLNYVGVERNPWPSWWSLSYLHPCQ